jgi:DNA mismatch repair protein MutS
LKNAHPECVLFFRMGDFYELFYDDAVKAAPVLDVALTRRGKDGGEDVAMCGVPVHAYEAYIPKLIRAGFRVAIAEQMEDPAAARLRAKQQKGGKALVDRQIIRIITPGTLTEERFLDSGRANYLAVLADVAGEFSLSWCDLSAGVPFEPQ